MSATNYYYFMKHWTELLDEEPVQSASEFLKTFKDTVGWWYSIDRPTEDGGDDPDWKLEDDLLCFLDCLAGFLMPGDSSVLPGEQWMWFLKNVTNDCYRESDLDDNDGPSVCTFSEMLESIGRGARTLLTHPGIASYKVTSYKPSGLGLPRGQEFTLSIALSWLPQACTFIAAMGEANVGVPGDPQEFWKYIHALHAAGLPIGSGGWSAPPWLAH